MSMKADAVYLVLLDYLNQMASNNVISQQELADARRLAAIRFGQESVWK